MTTRPKFARKTHARPTRSRATRRRTTQQPSSTASVTPVAIETSASGDAVIPVSVKGEGSSAEAVIPVEVPTGSKTRRKRAAVVPIVVWRRSAHSRRRRARTRPQQTQPQTPKFEPAYPKPWRTFVSDALNGVMDMEQAALELGVEYGQTAIAVMQSMLWPIFGRPASIEPVGRGKILASKTPAEVAGAALARAA